MLIKLFKKMFTDKDLQISEEMKNKEIQNGNHEENQLHHSPIEYMKAFWPNSVLVQKQFCQPPSEWPIAFSIERQNIILIGNDVIDPCISLKIVM